MIDYKIHIQSLCAEIGEAACYAICIEKLGAGILGLHPAPGWYVDMMLKGVDAKLIHLGPPSDPDNFLVENAGAFLSLITGQRWVHSRGEPTYKALYTDMTRVIDCMVRGKMKHFVIPALPPYQEYFDPLGESLTAKEGKVESKRVFVRV